MPLFVGLFLAFSLYHAIDFFLFTKRRMPPTKYIAVTDAPAAKKPRTKKTVEEPKPKAPRKSRAKPKAEPEPASASSEEDESPSVASEMKPVKAPKQASITKHDLD